ncbi:MAG: hypothetical protein ACLVD8_26740 [Enterocloster sp.]|uniref:hypothetical protein n=1 Tax=Enterocloster sp. TaxID=2719315 RepID=UPI00399BD403
MLEQMIAGNGFLQKWWWKMIIAGSFCMMGGTGDGSEGLQHDLVPGIHFDV